MKCFEILGIYNLYDIFLSINRKHEMFWNDFKLNVLINGGVINRKHEMFWNRVMELEKIAGSILTVNI